MLFRRGHLVFAVLCCCSGGVFGKSAGAANERERDVLRKLQAFVENSRIHLQARYDSVTVETREVADPATTTITYDLEDPVHHSKILQENVLDFILNFEAVKQNAWMDACNFDMKQVILGINNSFELTAGELKDSFSYMYNYSNTVAKLLDDHLTTATELEESYNTYGTVDQDAHTDLASELTKTFENITTHEKCMDARLWPIILRLNFYGLKDAIRCDNVMTALTAHGRTYKRNIKAEVCNMDSLKPEISHALRADIFCLTHDIESMGGLAKELSTFDSSVIQSNGEAVAEAEKLVVKTTQISDDTGALKGTLDTIENMLAMEKTLKNWDGTYKSECDQYRPTTSTSREISAMDISQMKKILMEFKGLA